MYARKYLDLDYVGTSSTNTQPDHTHDGNHVREFSSKGCRRNEKGNGRHYTCTECSTWTGYYEFSAVADLGSVAWGARNISQGRPVAAKFTLSVVPYVNMKFVDMSNTIKRDFKIIVA